MTAGPLTRFFCSGFGWIVTFTLGGLGAYLLWAHTGHLFAALPYMILLACPLMHLFWHRHHRHGNRPEGRK